MFGWGRKRDSDVLIEECHDRVVAASRDPALFEPAGFPDTVEGRFESLVLHALLVLRRARALPPPAADAAQDFVDFVFARLEVALRETGVGDFGVPKRMKGIARAFYDRTVRYDPLLDGRDGDALAAEIARRCGGDAVALGPAARHLLRAEEALAAADLDALLAGPPFPPMPTAPSA